MTRGYRMNPWVTVNSHGGRAGDARQAPWGRIPVDAPDAERTPYHFKRHAIQNCIYGVDVDSSAGKETAKNKGRGKRPGARTVYEPIGP